MTTLLLLLQYVRCTLRYTSPSISMVSLLRHGQRFLLTSTASYRREHCYSFTQNALQCCACNRQLLGLHAPDDSKARAILHNRRTGLICPINSNYLLFSLTHAQLSPPDIRPLLSGGEDARQFLSAYAYVAPSPQRCLSSLSHPTPPPPASHFSLSFSPFTTHNFFKHHRFVPSS